VAAAKAPHIVVVVAEGSGFPFEDPAFAGFPALRKLRANSRPFDSVFADDPSWTGTKDTLLAAAGARGPAELVRALKRKGYATTAVSATGVASGGFDQSVKALPTELSARVLQSLKSAGSSRAFVYASLDLRKVPAAANPVVPPATPITVPAIALSDRAPLDPVRFPVTPPPREPADRGALASSRQAAYGLLDREIGVLLAGLAREGLLSETVIALVSIGPSPRPERAAPPRQDLLFEDWLRGLLLIQVPGMKHPGVTASTLARMSDLAPTLAALGGATLVQPQGLNLAPALGDPARIIRETVLSDAARQGPRIGRSVRTDQFRFTQWPDGSQELFDETADPREWNNLAQVPAMRARKAELAKYLDRPLRMGKPTPGRAGTGRPLNVLMIIGDDLTAQYGQFGNVRTPNLDRLRARGRFFAKAYAPAPFCTPSRAAFLSGLSPARLELHRENAFAEIFTPQVPLMSEHFRAHGYYTASVGKVWDSQPGEARGWDLNEWLPPLPAGVVELPAQLIPKMPIEGGPTANADEAEGDGRRARRAVALLEIKRDKPLFLALGLVRPHPAWVAPRKYFDMYPADSITFTPAPGNDTVDIPEIAIKNRPQSLPGRMLAGREPLGFSADPEEARRGIAAYLACLTFMDAQLGLVLDALDRQDLWKDTIVILFGDNGHHFGDHGGLWRKNTLFEESLRVPMIIASPDQAQPGVATLALADLIDVYPTLVDLTGLPRPGTLDGVSLVPALKDPGATVQSALIQYRPTEPPRRGYSLRTARHRYTLWPDGSEELYDLTVDPGGLQDLSDLPAHATTMRALRKQLEGLVP